ncbi:MAG: acyltransferase [Oleiphilaceae bacterium]|nr:acyltransferase [Oleiphilaceae bacterium]
MMNTLRGVLALLLMLINTMIGLIPMMIVAVAKVLVPWAAFRRVCARIVMTIAETWAHINRAILGRLLDTRWEVRGDPRVSRDKSYLLLSNHQSWVDIAALVQVFNRRVPYYKFFLKQELVWVPLLGLAFWALDYPFMKRYSREYLEKHPEMKDRDLEVTRRACEKCRGIPVTVVNFPEGTRFTPAKHHKQQSPYRHLLRPKAGGISFVMASIGDQIDGVLDVSVIYPDGVPGFWDFLSNQVKRVVVEVHQFPLDQQWVRGDYRNDPQFRREFQQWLSDFWLEKDQRIEALRQEYGMSPVPEPEYRDSPSAD